MSRTKAKTYHKQDLRRDILSAARNYVAQNGHLTLSLRGLAGQIGVTTAAPYHHFADRRALLLAIAVEGFDELIGEAKALANGPGSPRSKLIGMGEAFIAFAEENPHQLVLMYESELTSPELDPALRSYQDAGYEAHLSVMAQARPELEPAVRSIRVMSYWSSIYGYAMLRNKFMFQPYERVDSRQKDIDTAIVERAVMAALAD